MPYTVQWGVRRVARVLGAAAVVTLAATGAASAATYTVTTQTDSNDGACTASLCSLRDAVVAADTAGGASTINVPAGTYTLTIASTGADDPTTGDLDVDNGADITLTGAGASSTAINGNGAGAFAVFASESTTGDRAFAVQKGAALTLSRVTIEDGTPSQKSSGLQSGGAIYSDGALTIAGDVTFSNDAAPNDGGAIDSDGDATKLSITGATFDGNSAETTFFGSPSEIGGGGAIAALGLAPSVTDSTFTANGSIFSGGAIAYAGGLSPSGGVTVDGSTFDGNTAEVGGAIAASGPGPLRVSGSSFSDNTAVAGGAAVNLDEGGVPGGGLVPAPISDFSGDSFTGNSAAEGGALALVGAPAPGVGTPTPALATLTGDEFDGNSTSNTASFFGVLPGQFEQGGAVLLEYEDANVDGSSFVGNSSILGGAISSLIGDVISLTNTTLSGNTAKRGGAVELTSAESVFVVGSLAPATQAVLGLDNSTIAHNTASTSGGGGGIDGTTAMAPSIGLTGPTGATGLTGVVNSIVADNAGGDCAGGVGATGLLGTTGITGTVDLGHNLDSDGTCFGTNGKPGAPIGPGDLVAVNPKVQPAADNGGTVMTDALIAGSPAIDAAAGSPFCPLTDARGITRPQAAGCDIGAYESEASALGVAASAPQTATTGVPFNATGTVTGTGPGPSTGTVLTATLPANTTVYGVSSTQGSCTQSGTPVTVTCSLGLLSNGAKASATIVVAGSQDGTVQIPFKASNDEGASAQASSSTVVQTPVTGPTGLTGPTATTGSATHITKTSATLGGSITTGKQSTTWFFQYGTTRKLGSATPVKSASADGSGSATVTGLISGTTYHYRLVAVNGSGHANGATRRFKTSGHKPGHGRVLVRASFLRVRHGHVSVPFTCHSASACRGLFTINVHARLAHARSTATIACTHSGHAGYRIRPGKTRTSIVRITPACASLLSEVPSHQLWAKLSSNPRTGQSGLLKIVRIGTSARSGSHRRAVDAFLTALLGRG